MTSEGEQFLAAVRKHFRKIFVSYGFEEVQAEDHPYTHAVFVAKSPIQYFRIDVDFRDSLVYAALGRLTEGLIGPRPIAPSRDAAHVREISQSFVVWLATGDRKRAFAVGRFTDDLEAAVERVAEAWARYGGALLDGDDVEWRRAAQLVVTRQLPSGEE